MNQLFSTLILSLALITGAYAQENTVARDIKAKSGQLVRVAIFTSVRPDCTPGALPTIRLVRAPEHGNLTVRKVKLSATNIKQCLAIEVPALVAFYKSAAGFEGSDSAILEVRSAQGTTQLQSFSISVSATASGPKIERRVHRPMRGVMASFCRAAGTPAAGA
jgi:hypothetical protein